jgi:CheY-like chemotaxis protein
MKNTKQTSPVGQERILLVDDNTELRELFVEILEGVGYRVTAVGDGQAALRILEEDPLPIDLVISDMVMPRLSGHELYHKCDARKRGIRFLFISGYFEHSSKYNFHEFHFLQKPFTEDVLLKKIRVMLDLR